jgi:RND family efflux transporter MFP subunit
LLAVAITSAVLYYGNLSRIPRVAVVAVEQGPAERVLSIVGRVLPKQVVNVRAEQPGQIVELLKDESEAVSAGEVIARVAAEEEIATLSASRAETKALEAELARARGQLARNRELVQGGFVSAQSLDDVVAEVETIQARLSAAQAAERQVEVRAEKFVIRAPIDGLILARPVDVGQVVSTETSLFDIGSFELEIEAEADEYYADAVQPGQTALINPAGSAGVFEAVVSRVSPRIDPTTGGRIVQLETEAEADGLLPGRTINTTIVVERMDNVISVPRSAVRFAGGNFEVLTVINRRVRIVPVELLDWPGARVIVTAGLAGNETVIITPSVLGEGDAVRILDAEKRGDP